MKSSPLIATLLLSGTAVAAPAPRALAPRSAPYNQTYANELISGAPCRTVTLLYARGTTQDGNIGSATDVGPLMMDALAALIGADALAVQGIAYDADVSGYLDNLLGNDDDGSVLMAGYVDKVRFVPWLVLRGWR